MRSRDGEGGDSREEDSCVSSSGSPGRAAGVSRPSLLLPAPPFPSQPPHRPEFPIVSFISHYSWVSHCNPQPHHNTCSFALHRAELISTLRINWVMLKMLIWAAHNITKRWRQSLNWKVITCRINNTRFSSPIWTVKIFIICTFQMCAVFLDQIH